MPYYVEPGHLPYDQEEAAKAKADQLHRETMKTHWVIQNQEVTLHKAAEEVEHRPTVDQRLRDQYAGQAMQGLINIGTFSDEQAFMDDCPNIARCAYVMADAMLAAREKP